MAAAALSAAACLPGAGCRGKRTQNNKTSLIKITGVESKKETEFYLGKRIAFIYKGKTNFFL